MAVTTETTPTTKRLGANYWKLWTASTVSNLGDGVSLAALPLLAATLTRDPRLVAGLATAAALPWLLFALISGALVDRLDRRRVMWVVDLARGGLVAVIAIAVFTDRASIVLLYVVAFCLGTAETLFDNAAQAIMPNLVERDQLETANGRQYSAELVSNAFVGPPLGSLLFSTALAAPFWVDSASFVVAAALVAMIRVSRPIPNGATASREQRSLFREIADGIRWLNAHHLLRTLALLLGTVNFAGQMAMGTFVLFTQDRLGVSERRYGLMLASLAAGGVVGGLVAGRLTRRVGQARSLLVVLAGSSVLLVVIGLTRDPVFVAALLAMNGLLGVWWNVITVSLRQQIIPDELLGRVNSVYRTVGWGSIPLGALAGGFLANATSLQVPWLVAGAVCFVALVAASALVTQHAIDEARAAAPAR
jgi:predicted MFS family arabinose efflux permease